MSAAKAGPAAHSPSPATKPADAAAAKAPQPARPANISEPLSLQLADNDIVQQPHSVRPALPRSRGPLIGIVIAGALVVAVLAWLAFAGREEPPPSSPSLGTRSDAVPAAPAVPAPVGPSAEPAATAEPEPAAAPVQPTTQPAAQPTPSSKPETPAQPAPKATKKPAPESAPLTTPGSRSRAVSKPAAPSAPVDPAIQRAREALQGLEEEPVLKVKPSEDEAPAIDPPVLEMRPVPDDAPPAP
jgi:hypothetical protein